MNGLFEKEENMFAWRKSSLNKIDEGLIIPCLNCKDVLISVTVEDLKSMEAIDIAESECGCNFDHFTIRCPSCEENIAFPHWADNALTFLRSIETKDRPLVKKEKLAP
jgi:hypothetical protein